MLLDRVHQWIQDEALLPAGARVLVGLSGGVDSVVLTHVLQRLGFDVEAAHVNYGLREEAEADETFVRQWCANQQPGIRLHVTQLDAAARADARNQSVQEAARELRYQFFAHVADRENITRVAVGHHRDDQAETLLLNLFRGSGVEGLAGMAPRRPIQPKSDIMLIRPLLEVGRDAIEAYAREHDLSWRTDTSNLGLKYQRGAVRHKVIPCIEAHFSGATDRIAHAAGLVHDYVKHSLRPELQNRFAACAHAMAEGGRLALDVLRDQPVVWRRRLILEALQRWMPEAPQTASAAEEVEALLDAQVGRRIEFKGGAVWREREHLRVLPASAAPETLPPKRVLWDEPVELPGGALCVEEMEAQPDTLDAGTPYVVYVDADRLALPLTVRTWEAGDRIQPLGMDDMKKVSDLLTDEQVPPHERPGVLVVCDDECIVWVVGHRVAHNVRVRPETRRIARFAYRPRDESA